LAKLVLGDIDTVEVGVAVVSLDFLDLELNFPPVLVVAFVLQVSQRYVKDSSFQAVSWDLYFMLNTLGLVFLL